MSAFIDKVLGGERRAVARLLTYVENQHPDAQTVLDLLYPHTGHAHLLGVTGAPGTGKSSLVNKIAKAYRQMAQKVAIIAVDPTSPFSGGAILGDRVRMQEHAGDTGIFIRSMASRGSLGGLAQAVDDAIKVLDAAGFEQIIIETVGAGQSEVEIAKTAHTTLVVEAPGLGDGIQAIKAGILEIADIFVVNKADRQGSERAVASLKTMLELGHPTNTSMMHHGHLMEIQAPPSPSTDGPHWQIPVLKTVAIKNEGIEELITAIAEHRQYLEDSGQLAQRNRNRLMDELENLLKTELMKRLVTQISGQALDNLLKQLENRQMTPYSAVQAILAD